MILLTGKCFLAHDFRPLPDEIDISSSLLKEVEEAFAVTFSGNGVRSSDLPPESELGLKTARMSSAFTGGVDYLRRTFPNKAISRLMGMVWEIVGRGLATVVLGPPVKSLSVACAQYLKTKIVKVCVFVPHDWEDQIAKDYVFQLGAIVFAGSQLVDFHNGRLAESADSSDAIVRAQMHEAEYLITLQKSGWMPVSGYHLGLLAKYPEGIRTRGAWKVLYEPMPFDTEPH